jgi:hypothetical protein
VKQLCRLAVRAGTFKERKGAARPLFHLPLLSPLEMLAARQAWPEEEEEAKGLRGRRGKPGMFF